MPVLYNRIAEILPTIHLGWCSLQKACDLAATVVTLRPAVTVEIGVFGGRSLIPMALACKLTGVGRIIAIDPWSAEASQEGYDATNAEWWGKLDHESVYQDFLARLQQYELRGIVEIQRMKSADAPVPTCIDLLHVDGQHTDQAVRDVHKFAPAVRVGGMCYLDDIDWAGGGVLRAVDTIKSLGFTELYRHSGEAGTGGMFQRLK